jgi:hypothetical protein
MSYPIYFLLLHENIALSAARLIDVNKVLQIQIFGFQCIDGRGQVGFIQSSLSAVDPSDFSCCSKWQSCTEVRHGVVKVVSVHDDIFDLVVD